MPDDLDEPFRQAIFGGLEAALAGLTPEQLAKLEPDIEDLVSRTVTEVLAKTVPQLVERLKLDAPEMLRKRRADNVDFEQHLSGHWGRAFDLAEMVMTIAYEVGESFNEKHRPKAEREQDLVFEALVRLHARACRIAEEVLVLLKAGYGQGGLARWRALHEVAVVADFIAQNGADTAERYFAHDAVESWKAMREFQRYAKRLGETQHTDEEVRQARLAYEGLVAQYGHQFAGTYGWAHAALGAADPRYRKGRGVTLAALEESVGAEHMRPYYRLASHGVHANPKGITFTPDLPVGEGGLLLAGASPIGLADAGHSALISLTYITATVLAFKAGEATGVVIGAMLQLTDEAGEAYLDAHRALDVSRTST